jgi:hypothetical protein
VPWNGLTGILPTEMSNMESLGKKERPVLWHVRA